MFLCARYPIRGTCFGCWDSAGELSAKSNAPTELSARSKRLSVKPKNLLLMDLDLEFAPGSPFANLRSPKPSKIVQVIKTVQDA